MVVLTKPILFFGKETKPVTTATQGAIDVGIFSCKFSKKIREI
jgi:hypothetical protein